MSEHKPETALTKEMRLMPISVSQAFSEAPPIFPSKEDAKYVSASVFRTALSGESPLSSHREDAGMTVHAPSSE